MSFTEFLQIVWKAIRGYEASGVEFLVYINTLLLAMIIDRPVIYAVAVFVIAMTYIANALDAYKEHLERKFNRMKSEL